MFGFSAHIFEKKSSNIKFREIPSSGISSCSMRTNRHVEADSRFSHFFANAPKKRISMTCEICGSYGDCIEDSNLRGIDALSDALKNRSVFIFGLRTSWRLREASLQMSGNIRVAPFLRRPKSSKYISFLARGQSFTRCYWVFAQ